MQESQKQQQPLIFLPPLLLTEDNDSRNASPCFLALVASACLRSSRRAQDATVDHWQCHPWPVLQPAVTGESPHTVWLSEWSVWGTKTGPRAESSPVSCHFRSSARSITGFILSACASKPPYRVVHFSNSSRPPLLHQIKQHGILRCLIGSYPSIKASSRNRSPSRASLILSSCFMHLEYNYKLFHDLFCHKSWFKNQKKQGPWAASSRWIITRFMETMEYNFGTEKSENPTSQSCQSAVSASQCCSYGWLTPTLIQNGS